MDEIDCIRKEVEHLGFNQVRTSSDVDKLPEEFFMFINSWCPNSSYARSLLHKIKPKYHNMYTIFAGQDIEPTEYFRKKYSITPSSPALYYIKNQKAILEIKKEQILHSDEKILQEVLERMI